ncbi:MAG TPA: DUF1289 domain-containing protein [Spongiibacteraceae bacterium]|nr:DUF1289 domain-containing protein [Spongiibacteraceae bacterium]
MIEDDVASPCISICALDEQDVCAGCWRDINEISGWHAYSAAQKREVLRLAEQRRREAGISWD